MGDENIRSTTYELTDQSNDINTENVLQSAQNMTGDGNTLSHRTTDSSGNELYNEETNPVNNVQNTPTTPNKTESVLKVDHNINKIFDDDCSANMSLNLKIEFEANDNETKKQVHEEDEEKNDNSVDNTEDTSELASNKLGNIKQKTQSNDESRNTLNALQNNDDAHLTYVDHDDGILKFLVGKIGERLAHRVTRIKSPTRSHANENKTTSVKSKDKYKCVELGENETERKGNLYTKRTDASQETAQAPKKEHRYSDDNDCYDFTHSQRGYMVLVINDEFARESRERDGAIMDLRKMKEIGRKFGFRELRYQMKDMNLTKPELESVLTDAQRADHSDCDCFLLMISTHGLETTNARKGGKTDHALVCADDQLIFTSTIIEMFNDSNCPSLKGKPKIFLIQACRGDLMDDGGTIDVAYPKDEDRTFSVNDTGNVHCRSESFDASDTKHGKDSWATNQSTSRSQTVYRESRSTRKNLASSQTVPKIYARTPYAIDDTPSLKCDNDMLVMYAIPPGMFAWRNTIDGSWMIDYLHQVLMDYNLRDPKNFLNLLTKVNALMSRRATYTPSKPQFDGKTAVSVIEHKLCKDIVFQ